MSESFASAYEILTEFIRTHPEIQIGESVTSIPEHVRAEFYLRFNSVREALVEERLPALLAKAQKLQDNYLHAETALSHLLAWEDSPIVSPVRRFLDNYRECLTRELFDPLFDLLKGRESLGGFGEKAADRMAALWPPLFRGGLEKWMTLSLIRILGPNEALRVDARLLGPGERGKSAMYAPFADVPDPEISGRFYFSQPPGSVFAVPDMIIHSSILNRYVGIRSEFKEGLYNAINWNQAREWTPIDADLLIAMENGLTLVYLGDAAQDISLIADVAKFCRPDLVLWSLESESMTRQEAIARMEICHNRLNPLKGSIIVTDEAWPDTGQEGDLNPDIHLVAAQYDESRLQSVIDRLMEPQNS